MSTTRRGLHAEQMRPRGVAVRLFAFGGGSLDDPASFEQTRLTISSPAIADDGADRRDRRTGRSMTASTAEPAAAPARARPGRTVAPPGPYVRACPSAPAGYRLR